MNLFKRLAWGLLAWTSVITLLHLSLNFDWDAFLNEFRPESERKLNVAYIPVT